ncbi:MAG: LytR C-terminal domain-containing protein, partial [Actinobacteria bacterium]|nr:LytR C-terminal domain-containing protein [Actinomycetota bacterium]
EGYKDEEVESEGFRSKRIKEKRKKGKKFFRIIAVMLALVVVATGVVFGYRYIKNKFFSKVGEIPEEEVIIIPPSLELGQDINLVIACAGENLDEPEVSSIIFSGYYSSKDALISLCIPVRTLMDIPGVGPELVGESVKVGGMDLLSLTLEEKLGMVDMKIDYHILLDVYNVVNKLGGIDLELDKEITVKNYDDGSTFKLEKGKNPVDGTKAVNFLKYFSGNDKEVPIENIINQKLLLDAIISKIAGESDEKLSDNLNLIKDFIDTDLSMEEQSKIFSTFSKIEPSKNEVHALNVSRTELEEGIVYIPDFSGLAEIFKKEGTAPEEVAAVEETVNLTILNGAGTPGLAEGVSELLKSKVFESGKSKYNILKEENADNFNYDTTEILVYSGQSYVVEAANDIKNILEVGNIIPREDEGANSDIIIVLGADYKAKVAEKAVSEEVAQIIKIIVLNGTHTNKLAATVTGILEDYFNAEGKIVEMSVQRDADNHEYIDTKIIIFTSREGVDEIAKKIQERLGVGKIEYSININNVDNVDISITLGSDYTK